jgi:hypothetical protein
MTICAASYSICTRRGTTRCLMAARMRWTRIPGGCSAWSRNSCGGCRKRAPLTLAGPGPAAEKQPGKTDQRARRRATPDTPATTRTLRAATRPSALSAPAGRSAAGRPLGHNLLISSFAISPVRVKPMPGSLKARPSSPLMVATCSAQVLVGDSFWTVDRIVMVITRPGYGNGCVIRTNQLPRMRRSAPPRRVSLGRRGRVYRVHDVKRP